MLMPVFAIYTFNSQFCFPFAMQMQNSSHPKRIYTAATLFDKVTSARMMTKAEKANGDNLNHMSEHTSILRVVSKCNLILLWI